MPEFHGSGRLHRFLLRLLVTIAVALAAVSWVSALAAGPQLGAGPFPSPFGQNGTPDAFAASRTALLYGLPLLASALTLAMLFLFWRPQYSHLPATLLVDLLPAKERHAVLNVYRAMLVPVFTLTNLLLVYTHFSSLNVALGLQDRLDTSMLWIIVVLLLVTTAFYAVAGAQIVGSIVRKVQRA